MCTGYQNQKKGVKKTLTTTALIGIRNRRLTRLSILSLYSVVTQQGEKRVLIRLLRNYYVSNKLLSFTEYGYSYFVLRVLIRIS
jgi:hypothetical protein